MVLPHRTLRERYQLVSEVGRGGMGRVWRAHDAHLNRTVAVKEILLGPGMDDDDRARVAARARREAQATAMGQHPNIVTVYDIVEDDGRPWIVMELLDGDSLLRLMHDRGPVPAERAAAWGLDLLDALTTAHDQGITHRDVKPENVMVTGSGRVVLTDFGIATIVDTAAVTQTAGVMGSAAYVAPERLASQPATPASDLWSLGATLYHAVTGVSPFQREGVPATLHAVLSVDPPQNLPGPLGAAISGMLVKDPLQRLDARACRELLGAAARGEQTTGSHLPPAAPTGMVPPGEASTGPVPGPALETTAALTQPRRTRRLSWPVVVLTLGMSALLVAAALVIINSWAEGGEDNDQAGRQTLADTSSSPSSDASATAEATEPGSGESAGDPVEEPAAEGMTWTEDPEGFAMLIPDGWVRRIDGASVYYDSPTSNAYLQIDRTPHSTDDEYAHVVEQESNSIAEERLPGYQRIRLEEVTDQTSFASAADWEFSWDRGAGTWRLLARNIAVTAGDYYTLAWSSGEEHWAGDTQRREHAIDSFDPF